MTITDHKAREKLLPLPRTRKTVQTVDVAARTWYVGQNSILRWVNTPTLDSCFGFVGHHQHGAECDPVCVCVCVCVCLILCVSACLCMRVCACVSMRLCVRECVTGLCVRGCVSVFSCIVMRPENNDWLFIL